MDNLNSLHNLDVLEIMESQLWDYPSKADKQCVNLKRNMNDNVDY